MNYSREEEYARSYNDEKYIIDLNLFKNKGFVKLSIGKKKHFKIIN